MISRSVSCTLPMMISRKILAFILGMLILNSATEFHQLLKFPFLIQHYRHHHHEDPTMSFINFLKIHYSSDHHPQDNDDREDNELPFKSAGAISHIDTPVITKSEAQENCSVYIEKSFENFPEGIPSRTSFAIFHPPRIV